MAYDRTKAVAYAERFWDRPCDDGVFWLSNERISVAAKRRELHAPESEGWEARFVKDGAGAEKAVFRRAMGGGVFMEKLIQEWEGLADCAHFLSRCLSAGGAKVDERGVASLVHTLQARSDTKTLCERVSKDAGQRVINSGIFKQGDMFGYFNVSDEGDYGGAKRYTHSTMFTGKLNAADVGRVTCHTKSRFGGKSEHFDEWWLDTTYNYTLIHFAADDAPIEAAVGATMAGWWKVAYGARVEYYYILKDGRAYYTLTAPKNKNAMLGSGAAGSAYWFQQLKTLSFVWRKTGTIDVWTANGSDFDVTVNGATRGTASKMF